MQEAARLESARIYGATVQPAPPVAEHVRPTGPELDAAIAYWSKLGQSVPSVAFRLGCTRGTVREALERMAIAS